MKTTTRMIVIPLIAALVLQLTIMAAPAAAAPGDLVADVVVPDEYPTNIAPSVAFDGTYLYYLGYGTPVLHRIDVPPAGAVMTDVGARLSEDGAAVLKPSSSVDGCTPASPASAATVFSARSCGRSSATSATRRSWRGNDA